MDKIKRKELKRQITQQEFIQFRNSLPMDEELFPKLFDYLDDELGKKGCHHTAILTQAFLDTNKISNQTHVFEWLAKNGGFCDCEILSNVEDLFKYLEKPISQSTAKIQMKKQKLSSLKTDFGLSIPKIPAPWVLTETILDDKPIYTFQIGKGTDCIVTLEISFPTEQLANDAYWLDLWTQITKLSNHAEDLVVERFELDMYSCIVVKSKHWVPVFYWAMSHQMDKCSFMMKTGSSRHKGDFKELITLLNSVVIEIK